jgi:hypothetical protein
MTVTKAERKRIVDEMLAKQKRELSERMSRLGRIRSPKKRKAGQKNIQKARAVKLGKVLPKAT